MNIFKRYNLKSILLTVVWVVIGSGCLALLVAAVHTKEIRHCKGLEISIHGVSNNFFIDESDVKHIISSYVGDNITGMEIEGFNLVAMENELKRDVWIKNAEMFFDNNEILQASVEEREPIARIFTTTGSSFYIDNSNMILPLSDKLSARLPVFTGFPTENKVLTRSDSNLVKDIHDLSMMIQRDSFLMAMIEQVDITPQRTFEMLPKVGDQVIVFGDASGAEQKFKKLQLFYKKVMLKYGWNRYSMISLQYKGQVIGKLKGKDDFSSDSLRTQEIMRLMAFNAAKASSDSLQFFMQDNEKNTTSVSLIEQSMERDDEGEEPLHPFKNYDMVEEPVKAVAKNTVKPVHVVKKLVVNNNKPVIKPVVKPVIKKQILKPALVKPAIAKPAAVKPPAEKPKAEMPKKNDY
ncbi:MAG: hypothetical protein ABIT58_07400 [Ferruginibacter sp.]